MSSLSGYLNKDFQKIQNRCMRSILKYKKQTHVKSMLNILNTTSIETEKILQCINCHSQNKL